MESNKAAKKFKVNDKVYVLGVVGNHAYGYIKEIYTEGGKEKLAVYFPVAKQIGENYEHSDFVGTLAEKKAHSKDACAGGGF